MTFSPEQISDIARSLGVDHEKLGISQRSLTIGFNEEFRHLGAGNARINALPPDYSQPASVATRAAMAHLLERPDYYDGLMIAQAAPTGFWQGVTPGRFWDSARLGALLLVFVMLLSAAMIANSHLKDDMTNMVAYGILAICSGILSFLYLGVGLKKLA